MSGVSVASALVNGGLTTVSAVAFGISASWAANNCIKNSVAVQQHLKELRGLKEGKISLAQGEARLGKNHAASRAEVDTFLEAITRAKSLGLEAPVKCLTAEVAASKET